MDAFKFSALTTDFSGCLFLVLSNKSIEFKANKSISLSVACGAETIYKRVKRRRFCNFYETFQWPKRVVLTLLKKFVNRQRRNCKATEPNPSHHLIKQRTCV